MICNIDSFQLIASHTLCIINIFNSSAFVDLSDTSQFVCQSAFLIQVNQINVAEDNNCRNDNLQKSIRLHIRLKNILELLIAVN